MAHYKRHRPRAQVRCVICTPRAQGRDTLATKLARITRRDALREGYALHAR